VTKLLTLERWAERYSPSPHIKTVRRWAREGKILPPPKKNGRAYYVDENAEYSDWSAIGGAAKARRG